MHALDHPGYGASAAVPRETTGEACVDLVHELFVELFPGEAVFMLVRCRDVARLLLIPRLRRPAALACRP